MSLSSDQEHWLSLVSDLHSICFEEVLGHAHLLAVSHIEESVARSFVKVDIMNDISSLVAVVGNNTLTNKASLDFFLEFIFSGVVAILIVFQAIPDVEDLVKNGFGRHEASTAINDDVASRFVLVGDSLEARPNLHVEFWYVDWLGSVEEPWSMSELKKSSITHCLLDNDIQELLISNTTFTIGIVNVSSVDCKLSFNIDI
jgi:hypothetical protein